MLSAIEKLRADTERLLVDSGFPKEHYYIKTEKTFIVVMFDSKAAVEYFEGDFNYSELSDRFIFSYEKNGKRHCAVIR